MTLAARQRQNDLEIAKLLFAAFVTLVSSHDRTRRWRPRAWPSPGLACHLVGLCATGLWQVPEDCSGPQPLLVAYKLATYPRSITDQSLTKTSEHFKLPTVATELSRTAASIPGGRP